MTQIQFPSGEVIDFENANEQQIKDAVDGLRERNPELFVEKATSPTSATSFRGATFDDIVARLVLFDVFVNTISCSP